MCGIAGIVSFGAAPDREQLAKMTRTLAHRGPDDEGLFVEGPCGLGFRRLSIIDLEAGHQPMTSGPITVAFNGEIYNYRELREELRAHGRSFETHSDTEVLLAAYREWGDRFVERLDGMFAFGLWDAERQRLVCARDRFGEKPFYWSRVGGVFLFGSELKALVAHPLVARELDPGALRRYLAFECVPTPHSIFRGVRKLREAHRLVLDADGLREERYWRLPCAPASGPKLDADDAAAGLRERLQTAVRRRLVADVPLGVFLSGGVDSSAVVAMAAEASPRLQTFSIGFEEASFDESRYARLVAQRFGTEHFEERLTAAACLDLLPRAAEQLDEPLADPSYLPTFLLSSFARKQVTVALGGDGADELFAGYDTFVAHPLAAAYAHSPAALDGLLKWGVARLPVRSSYMSLEFRLKSFLAGVRQPPRYRHQAWIGSFTPEDQRALLTPAYRPGAEGDVYGDIDDFAADWAELPEGSLEWALRYYLQFYMKDDILVKVDRASMAASLEVRAPFLDTELSSYVARLPARLKLHGLSRKWLLKRALRGLVPDEILDRKKQGFALPVAAWLRGPLRPLLEELLSEEALRRGGIFEPREVRRRLDDHFAGRSDERKPLWTLAMFELWRRRWM